MQLSDLASYAKQKRLHVDDWIWRPGLKSWLPVKDVPGLLIAPSQNRAERVQSNQGGVQINKRSNLKERTKDQIKNFALMFLYLWIVFGLLALHESIILSQHKINYQSHGFAIINALVFAKVMLVAEDLRMGNRLNDKPLIYSILLKSLMFGVALICFHVVEHVFIGAWHGKTMAETISEIGIDRLGAMVSVTVIATVALIPFFILSEISRVIGGDSFWSLIFRGRSP